MEGETLEVKKYLKQRKTVGRRQRSGIGGYLREVAVIQRWWLG